MDHLPVAYTLYMQTLLYGHRALRAAMILLMLYKEMEKSAANYNNEPASIKIIIVTDSL